MKNIKNFKKFNESFNENKFSPQVKKGDNLRLDPKKYNGAITVTVKRFLEPGSKFECSINTSKGGKYLSEDNPKIILTRKDEYTIIDNENDFRRNQRKSSYNDFPETYAMD